MTRYAVAQLQEIDELVDGRCPFRPVRLHFGITSFGVTTWTARAAGDRIINEHDEQDVGDEELFLVLHGRALFELDGDRIDAPAGTLVFSPSGVKRTAFAEEAGTTIVALDGTPGKAYEPRGWELWTPLAPLYDAGEYAEVARRLRVLVEDHPYALLLYNLACCESRTGKTADALDHLRQAIAISDEFLGFAKDDPDFAAIRNDPGFEELTGS
jgi:tetratricopeptide (TPR) repeat protein